MGERKINIMVPDEMADAISSRVADGRYGSTDDVMQAAIRALLREEADEAENRLDAIRERIRRSVEDPRPNLSSTEARRHLDALYSRHKG